MKYLILQQYRNKLSINLLHFFRIPSIIAIPPKLKQILQLHENVT